MESEAIVARVDGQMAFVEVQQAASGCGRCFEAGGCGSGLRNQKPRLYRLPNPIGARAGDSVILSVGEGVLLRVSLLTYGLPVLAAILGAAAGTAFWSSDNAVDSAAMAGAGLGLALTLLLQSRTFGHGEPLLSMRLKYPVINQSEDALS